MRWPFQLLIPLHFIVKNIIFNIIKIKAYIILNITKPVNSASKSVSIYSNLSSKPVNRAFI